jgi:hypothetical protein
MRRTNALRCASAVFLVILVPIVSRAQRYAITDLGTLPGDTASLAWGMNSSAMVVGGLHPWFFLDSHLRVAELGLRCQFYERDQ